MRPVQGWAIASTAIAPGSGRPDQYAGSVRLAAVAKASSSGRTSWCAASWRIASIVVCAMRQSDRSTVIRERSSARVFSLEGTQLVETSLMRRPRRVWKVLDVCAWSCRTRPWCLLRYARVTRESETR